MNEYGYIEGVNCKWEMLHPRMTMEHLGYIPGWLRPNDTRSAKEQLDAGYRFGGFRPFYGFKMLEDGTLAYPGDPDNPPLAKCQLRDETIYFYQSAWVAIRQKDGSYEVARID